MVEKISSPDNTDLEAGNIAAPAMAAGFASVSKSDDVEPETSAKAEARKSIIAQLAAYCGEKFKTMREGTTNRFFAKGSADEDFNNPYKKFWFSTALGPSGCGVSDCGNCISLAGTVKRPVSDKQLAIMVQAALNRKSPPWETIYMFNHRGKPDLGMAQRVQNVINQMGVGHRISACVDPNAYPASASDFDRMLRDMFRKAATGQTGQERPGFTAAQKQRPGFVASQPV